MASCHAFDFLATTQNSGKLVYNATELDLSLCESGVQNHLILNNVEYTELLEQSAGGDFVIDSDQVDLFIMTILVCSMAVCFCIGWLAHEMGAK